MNSLWGKLAQKAGHNRIVYTHSAGAFHRLIDDPTLNIVDFDHISQQLDRVVVGPKPEFAKAPYTNNTVVAAFVTSLARLRLYEYLRQVDDVGGIRLYCDTYVIYSVYVDSNSSIFKFINTKVLETL